MRAIAIEIQSARGIASALSGFLLLLILESTGELLLLPKYANTWRSCGPVSRQAACLVATTLAGQSVCSAQVPGGSTCSRASRTGAVFQLHYDCESQPAESEPAHIKPAGL